MAAPDTPVAVNDMVRQLKERRQKLANGPSFLAGLREQRLGLGTPRSRKDDYGSDMRSSRRFYPVDSVPEILGSAYFNVALPVELV